MPLDRHFIAWARRAARSALWFWEPARLLYNAVLLGVVAISFMTGLPYAWDEMSPALFAFFVVMGGFANVAYCAAYPVDFFLQFAGMGRGLIAARLAVLLGGIIFASALTYVWATALLHPLG